MVVSGILQAFFGPRNSYKPLQWCRELLDTWHGQLQFPTPGEEGPKAGVLG